MFGSGADAAEAIAQYDGLTSTELRVLLTVVDAGSAPRTAAALGIADATVSTHLRRLFAKIGISRQLELISLVAGFSGGLAR